MTRFWDGRTDRWSDCTPRPAFAFGDAGKNRHHLSYRAPTSGAKRPTGTQL